MKASCNRMFPIPLSHLHDYCYSFYVSICYKHSKHSFNKKLSFRSIQNKIFSTFIYSFLMVLLLKCKSTFFSCVTFLLPEEFLLTFLCVVLLLLHIRNLHITQDQKNFLCFRSFIIFHFTVKSVIYFELLFAYVALKIFFFTYGYTIFFQPNLLRNLFFLHWITSECSLKISSWRCNTTYWNFKTYTVIVIKTA